MPPAINEPALTATTINFEDVHMEAGPFVDVDAGDVHTATQWEVWTRGAASERVWSSLQVGTIEMVHVHLGDGEFENSHTGFVAMLPDTEYQLRVRFRDSSNDSDTNWSPFSTRDFMTGPITQPFPLELEDVLTTPSPVWTDSNGVIVVLPSGSPAPRLIVEGDNGSQLLQIAGLNGFVNQVTNPFALPNHANVRVRIEAGDSGGQFNLDATDLSFTDSSSERRTIYLPSVALAPGEQALFWVGSDGSTYEAHPSQTQPDFSHLARGAAVPWVAAPGYRVEIVASGFQLPVSIAFVPNPGPNLDDPLYYVTELYGAIKVISRSGAVGTYASGLLNFDPTGDFPGSGEQGIGGITVEPTTGDLFVSMVTDTDGLPGGDHHPKVIRLHSVDGGKTAATQSTILDMPGELQGQSHFVSNLTIGPHDGKLYVHNGDGLNIDSALNLDSYRGKVLRMNLDGTPIVDNPFYDASNGINARDYVFAYGLRNPFGGTWRQLDGKHYEVEIGPTVDRLAKVESGDNLGWDGTDASMSTNAIYNWTGESAVPVSLAFIQDSDFAGSGFPSSKQDHLFVTQSGPTYGTGPQPNSKVITEFVLDAEGDLVSGPIDFARYVGSGKATAIGLAAGPDGLYFTDLYKDLNYITPIDAGANVLRIRYIGLADFVADATVGDPPLTVQFTDASDVPGATSYYWDFGDGNSSEVQNPVHTYTEEGVYSVTLTVTGTAGAVTKHKQNFINTSELAGSTIEVFAAGHTGEERMELQIEGVAVAHWTVGGNPSARDFQRFVYQHSSPLSPTQIRVAFTNDGSTQLGIDRNLTVDRIQIDGAVFETEGPDVFSIGSFDAADFCSPGFKQHETLFCDGYFRYAPTFNPGVISVGAAAITVSESGSSATLPVVRTLGSNGTVSVSFTTVAGSATAGNDFAATSGVVTFHEGETQGTIVIPLIDDFFVEPTEQFTLLLSQPTGGAALLEPFSAVVSVQDDDGEFNSTVEILAAGVTQEEIMALQIDGVTVASWTVGGDPQLRQFETFVYEHHGPVSPDRVRILFTNDLWDPITGIDRDLTVDAIRIDGARFETEDAGVFSVGSASATSFCSPGYTQNETLFCDGYFQFAPLANPGKISVGAATIQVSEGDASAIIPVVRTEGSEGTVSVSFATSAGTALPGSDFTPLSGVVTFLPGQTANSIVIPLLDDAVSERSERFSVVLRSPTGGAQLQQPRQATVVIEDDDPIVGSIIEVFAAGDTNDEILQLQIDGVTVTSWTVGGDPQARDFDAYLYVHSGPVTPDQIRIVFANDAWHPTTGYDRNLYVDAISIDGVRFETEAPAVFSEGSANATHLCGAGYSQNEGLYCNGYFQFPPLFNPGTIALGAAAVSVSEGLATATIPVIRIGGSEGTVSVSFATAAGSATPGTDFVATSGILTFLNGQTTNSIVIPLIDDLFFELEEQFTVDLSDPIGGAELASPQSAVVSIPDNDPADGSVIEIFAAGDSGEEQMTLEIDGVEAASWTVGGNPQLRQFQTFSYLHNGALTPSQVRLVYSNDGAALSGGDRNLTVDRIRISGVTYETESPDVFSIGSFDAAAFCSPGFKQHETLFCNGYFHFGSSGSQSARISNEDAQLVDEGKAFLAWQRGPALQSTIDEGAAFLEQQRNFGVLQSSADDGALFFEWQQGFSGLPQPIGGETHAHAHGHEQSVHSEAALRAPSVDVSVVLGNAQALPHSIWNRPLGAWGDAVDFRSSDELPEDPSDGAFDEAFADLGAVLT